MCADAADARAAMLWASETGEEFTVMSGAHSYAGYSTWEAADPPGLVADQQDWLQSIYRSMQSYVQPQSYQNWPDRTLTDWKSAYYGPNLQRLTQVKAKYDPHDRFTYAQSIPLSA